jgi:Secretion system C-terminal sorting domain
MKNNYNLSRTRPVALWKSVLSFLIMLLTVSLSNAQVTTNGGSGLAPTYPDLATAITALNGAVISSPVIITLTGNETAPIGGYGITAEGTATNTILIQGTASTITASGALVAGSLTDAVFKLVGADFVTLQNFVMQENAANTTTTAATNNMTEWGVALLYATATNGSQDNTIQNNSIVLNRTYQNTFGIYANATHTAIAPTTSVTATGVLGGNSGLKIYSNVINNVNNGIVVVGPTAIADQNTRIDIGGGSLTTANTITNYGTTGTFSTFANVSGTVNGILVRNSNGTNISYNTVTSSVGGVTVGTLNGIQVPASSNAPVGLTFTNTITNNSVSLRSGVITGNINGINFGGTTASATSTLNISNNDFNNFGHTTATASGTIVFILTNGTDFVKNINNNTFTNISVTTTGSVTFISHGASMILNATHTISNNRIITAFTKTGAGGTITGLTSGTSSVNGSNSVMTNNNFSNITVTGATTIIGITNTDGAGTSPNRTVTGNIFNNWVGGTSAITGMSFSYIGATSTISNNTITNISGQGAITGITISNTFAGGNPLNIANNTITGLVSSGAGGIVVGITCGSASPVVNISKNIVNTLLSTAAVTISGIIVSDSNVTTGTSVSENTINNLSNLSAAGVGIVTGIQIAGTGVGNVIQRNLIYDLNVASTNAAAEANGIRVTGGTNTFRNNMIRFGSGVPNAILVSGFNEVVGTNTIVHNSVFISGSPATGTANSFSFNGNQTVNVRSFRNNIFFNARSNSGATGKNYAVKVGGTGVNPTGLTVNNNVYYANGTGSFVGLYGGVDLVDLATWQAAVGQDASSVVADPLYVSNTDLNLQVGSPAIDIAANLGAVNDFAGDSRPGLNALFDIGADEKDGIPLVPNDIQATSFINPLNGASRGQSVPFAIQASFTNNGTANQTNVTVRYRILDATLTEVYNQTVVIPSLASFASTTVTFPNATLAALGVHTIFARAELLGDTVLANDEINGTLNVSTPLSGTYTVGTAGNYPSLTNATGIFDALNNIGASGNITINVISDLTGETGTVALNEIAGGFTTLIKPFGGARNVTGSNVGALIRLNGADNVTLNGSTAGTNVAACLVGGDATLRQLTFTNTNIATSAAVISVQSGANGAQNNTIKNIIVSGQDPLTTLLGISIGGNTPGSTGADNDNNRVENCAIQKSIFGIYSGGFDTANKNTGTVISNNDLSAAGANRIRRMGILLFNDSGANVNYNNVSVDTNESSDGVGIGLGLQNVTTTTTTSGGIVGALVSNNRINGVISSSTTGFSAAGIAVAGDVGAPNIIQNNMISGVTAPSTSPDIVAGIFVAGVTGSNTKLYNNTISNSGDRGTVTSQIGSFGIAISGTNPIVELKNNIVSNTQTSGGGVNAKSYAIGMTSTTFTNLDSNYNDFVSSGANDGGNKTGGLDTVGTDYATLALWQAAVADDANSVEIAPVFVSATDLHLNTIGNSTLENLGTPIATVTTDFDCEARNATTPDMGADEGVFLSTNQFEFANGLRTYPNPVNAILNIEYTSDLSNVSVYNLLGQQVLTKKVTTTSTQIDLSSLNAGTYLVKVEAGSVSKTLKVFKK